MPDGQGFQGKIGEIADPFIKQAATSTQQTLNAAASQLTTSSADLAKDPSVQKNQDLAQKTTPPVAPTPQQIQSNNMTGQNKSPQEQASIVATREKLAYFKTHYFDAVNNPTPLLPKEENASERADRLAQEEKQVKLKELQEEERKKPIGPPKSAERRADSGVGG